MAIKISLKEKSYIVEEVKCIEKIRKFSKINSQFVVKIYESYELFNKLAFTMEWLDFSLVELLQRKVKLGPEQEKHIACGILRGIQAGHGMDICHRDIKPANIMFNKKLIPKICDWGLCSNDSKYSQTQAYIAPEQFMKSDSKDKIDLKKVDSWSLGIVLYYLLHKKTPFTNE